MSPSFSTSSSDHRFGLRLVIAVFAATSVLLLCAGYANYRLRGLERHPQDVQLFQLERMKGPFDRLVLSDSVTENATAAMAFSEDTLPLLTHGWMRLAGQYLMFERVLARGPVHAMDFFMVPDMVVMDVDDEAQGRIRSTYTDTLFTRGEEIGHAFRSAPIFPDLDQRADEHAHHVFQKCVGLGLDPQGARFNHSCEPNCAAAFQGRTLVVHTLRPCSADEEVGVRHRTLVAVPTPPS